MKLFSFFVNKVFLRKALLFLGILLLLFMADYLTFVAARSIFSTIQGYEEIKCLDQEGLFISNLNPNSNVDVEKIENESILAVYEYISSYFNYAFCTGGFYTPLINSYDMDVSLCYLNEEYYRLQHIEITQGTSLRFDYPTDGCEAIPVLVGKGLSLDYPVGSMFYIEEPVLNRTVSLEVVGVLEENTSHSNYYALNSKSYYNFTIIVPVNIDFIIRANADLYNGPSNPDHSYSKEREHGMIKKKQKRSAIPWDTDCTQRSIKPGSYWRYCKARRSSARSRPKTT